MSKRPRLYGSIRRTDCCGLDEIYDLTTAPVSPWNAGFNTKTRMAYIATTIPCQRKEIRALRAAGFKSKGSWRNPNSGNTVTLWVRMPTKRKRRKK